jgi:hypothetical protein
VNSIGSLTFAHRSHTTSTSRYSRERVQHHLPMSCAFGLGDCAFQKVNFGTNGVSGLHTIVPSRSPGGRCES